MSSIFQDLRDAFRTLRRDRTFTAVARLTLDPLTFAAICAIITIVALAASWIPARRASRVDPLVAIRHD